MKYNPLKIDSGSSNSNRKIVPIRPGKKNRNCFQKKLSLNTSGAILQEHEATARGQTPFCFNSSLLKPRPSRMRRSDLVCACARGGGGLPGTVN